MSHQFSNGFRHLSDGEVVLVSGGMIEPENVDFDDFTSFKDKVFNEPWLLGAFVDTDGDSIADTIVVTGKPTSTSSASIGSGDIDISCCSIDGFGFSVSWDLLKAKITMNDVLWLTKFFPGHTDGMGTYYGNPDSGN